MAHGLWQLTPWSVGMSLRDRDGGRNPTPLSEELLLFSVSGQARQGGSWVTAPHTSLSPLASPLYAHSHSLLPRGPKDRLGAWPLSPAGLV